MTPVRPRRPADPLLRLVVLHHAGGSHLAYRRWAQLLPQRWEACLVDAPGRGYCAVDPPLRAMDDLVVHVVGEIGPLLDRPCAVFGHSMGAVVGFAVTVELAARGLPLPLWLGVSAHPGPRTPDVGDRRDLHRLRPEALRTALHVIGGLPPALLGDDALWAQIEPRLRADLEVAERWRPTCVEVLPVPVTAYCGAADPVAGAAAMRRWAVHTTRFQGVREFPGRHFYLNDDPAAVVAAIVSDVGAELARHALVASG